MIALGSLLGLTVLIASILAYRRGLHKGYSMGGFPSSEKSQKSKSDRIDKIDRKSKRNRTGVRTPRLKSESNINNSVSYRTPSKYKDRYIDEEIHSRNSRKNSFKSNNKRGTLQG